jgi:predicted DNA-binding transcriptional regulator AlpA
MDRQELLREKQVSKWINASTAALRRWRREGKGPKFVKLGRLVRYRVEDVEAWIGARSGS